MTQSPCTKRRPEKVMAFKSSNQDSASEEPDKENYCYNHTLEHAYPARGLTGSPQKITHSTDIHNRQPDVLSEISLQPVVKDTGQYFAKIIQTPVRFTTLPDRLKAPDLESTYSTPLSVNENKADADNLQDVYGDVQSRLADLESFSHSPAASPTGSDMFHDTCDLADYLPPSTALPAMEYEPTMMMHPQMLMPTPTGLLNSCERHDLASPQLSIPSTPADYTEFSGYLPGVLLCNNNNLFSPLPVDTEENWAEDTRNLSRRLAGQSIAPADVRQAEETAASSEPAAKLDVENQNTTLERKLSFTSKQSSKAGSATKAFLLHASASPASGPPMGNVCPDSAQPQQPLVIPTKELSRPQSRLAAKQLSGERRRTSLLRPGCAQREALTDLSDPSFSASPSRGILPEGNTMQLAWQPSFAEEYKKLLEAQMMSMNSPSMPQMSKGARPSESWQSPLIQKICNSLKVPPLQREDTEQRLAPLMADLQVDIEELSEERDEASGLLESYREALNKERSQRSKERSNADLTISRLTMELHQVQKEYTEQEDKFQILHKDKYVPLKNAYMTVHSKLLTEIEEHRVCKNSFTEQQSHLREAVEQREILQATLQKSEKQSQQLAVALEEEKRAANDKILQLMDQLEDQQAELRSSAATVQELQACLAQSEGTISRLQSAQCLPTEVGDMDKARAGPELQDLKSDAEITRLQTLYKSEHAEKLKLLQICDQLLTEAERAKATKCS